ncbi:MAG: hypothetical protein ACLFV7_07045, partial [Phycisphaerae bacterium]
MHEMEADPKTMEMMDRKWTATGALASLAALLAWIVVMVLYAMQAPLQQLDQQLHVPTGSCREA